MATSIIQGAANVFDNQLRSSNVNANYGGSTTIYIGRLTDANNVRRIVIDMDLSSITSGDTASSAKLELYDIDYVNRTSDCAVNIYAVSAANADLVEGTVNDGLEAGSSCWAYKAYDPAAPTAWAGSAGLGTAGTDYVNTLLATGTFIDGVSGLVEFTFNAAGLTWLEGRFGNASGNWLVMFGDESVNWTLSGFYTSEYAVNTDLCPKFTIVHSAAAAAATSALTNNIEKLITLRVL